MKYTEKKKWSRFFLNNGTTLQSGTKAAPKWGPSCGHENGSTFFFQCTHKTKGCHSSYRIVIY